MKKRLLFILFLIYSLICSAQRFQVKVIGIADGDSFKAINNDNLQIRFRIYGIDAPEKKQPFANKSKQFLSSLIYGKIIIVDVKSQDRYGRYIASVYTQDGKDVALLMLNEGMAWHFVRYDNNEFYSSAERIAKKDKRGLWSDSKPIAPWKFRK